MQRKKGEAEDPEVPEKQSLTVQSSMTEEEEHPAIEKRRETKAEKGRLHWLLSKSLKEEEERRPTQRKAQEKPKQR